MKPSAFYEFTVPAWGAYTLTVSGDYFKILASTGAVSVKAKWGELKKLTAGQGLEDSPFDRLELRDESGAANTVRVFVGDKRFIDGMVGQVNIGTMPTPKQASSAVFDNQAKTVTNVSAVLLAANANRQYLLVQNKDTAGNLYLSFGKAATAANGVKVTPGGAFELIGAQSTQDIYAIGDIANNANVTTVEG